MVAMFANRVGSVMPLFDSTDPAPLENITGALTSGLSDTADSAMGAIASILPYALAIVGAVLVVTIGIKVFKKISGK